MNTLPINSLSNNFLPKPGSFNIYSSFYIVFILLIVYNKFLTNLLPSFTYLDEIFMGFFCLGFGYRIIVKQKLDYLALGICLTILLFILFTYLGKYYSTHVNVIAGALIHLKWFIFYYIVQVLFWEDYLGLQRCINLIIIISLIGLLLNFLMQQQFNSIFNKGYFNMRSGRLRLIGFDMHPNNLGLLMMLIFLYYNFFSGIPSYFKVILSSFVFIGSVIFFVGTRNVLSILPFVYIYLLFIKKDKVVSISIITIFCAFLSILLVFYGETIITETQENLESLTKEKDDTGYLRGLMIFHGFEIMEKNFPIGTGMSTFGTVLSQNSQVYYDIKFGRIPVLWNLEGSAIFDSNIASVAGEAGFLGILIMLLLLYTIFYLSKKALQLHSKYSHCYCITII